MLELTEFLREKMLDMLNRRAYSRKMLESKIINYIKLSIKQNKPARLMTILQSSEMADSADFSLRGEFWNSLNLSITQILDRFEEIHLIDDYAYAKSVFESETKLKIRGVKLAKMKLRNCGISEEIINQIYGDINFDELRIDQIKWLKSKYEQCLQRVDKNNYKEVQKIRRRISNQANRRGIGFDIINEVMRVS